jgi:hypothetical protein
VFSHEAVMDERCDMARSRQTAWIHTEMINHLKTMSVSKQSRSRWCLDTIERLAPLAASAFASRARTSDDGAKLSHTCTRVIPIPCIFYGYQLSTLEAGNSSGW